jgi:hypothetical protein
MLAKSKYQNVEQLTFDIKPSKWMLMINDSNPNWLLKSKLLTSINNKYNKYWVSIQN